MCCDDLFVIEEWKEGRRLGRKRTLRASSRTPPSTFKWVRAYLFYFLNS